jgi:hypothetical protein
MCLLINDSEDQLCLTDNKRYHQLSVRGLFGDADVKNQTDGSWQDVPM